MQKIDKLANRLKSTINSMFKQYEKRFLSEMEKGLNTAKADLDNLTILTASHTRIFVEYIKNNNSEKVVPLTNESEYLEQVLAHSKRMLLHSIASHMLLMISELLVFGTVNIRPPQINSAFREKNNN